MPDTLLEAGNSKNKRDSACFQRADSLGEIDPQAVALQDVRTSGCIRVLANAEEVLALLGESRQPLN